MKNVIKYVKGAKWSQNASRILAFLKWLLLGLQSIAYVLLSYYVQGNYSINQIKIIQNSTLIITYKRNKEG